MIGLSRTALVTKVNGVRLKSTFAADKRAVVVVFNPNGSFNREVPLTGPEYAALKGAGNIVPPGVTSQEWTEGRAQAYGKGHDLGDINNQGGVLQILYAQRLANGFTSESMLTLQPGEYSGTLPNITVASAVLATLQSVHKPISLNSGVLI